MQRIGPAGGIGTMILAAAVVALGGCQRGSAPSNGLVEIANLASVDATFYWQSPGMYGGAGKEPIARCSLYARGFAPGDEEFTIATSTGSRSFTLAAPSTGQLVLWLVIDADGTVRETTAAGAPASPYCAG